MTWSAVLTALLALSITAAAPAARAQPPAPAPVPDPSGLVADLSFEDIVPVLRDAGLKADIVPFNGRDVARVVDPETGLVLALTPRACTGPDVCAGLWMFAIIDDRASPNELGLFNAMSMAVRAGIEETDTEDAVVLDRYMIADYGTTRGSFVINVRVLFAMVPQWHEFKQAAGDVRRAVSYAPAGARARALDAADRALLRAIAAEPGMRNGGPSNRPFRAR